MITLITGIIFTLVAIIYIIITLVFCHKINSSTTVEDYVDTNRYYRLAIVLGILLIVSGLTFYICKLIV